MAWSRCGSNARRNEDGEGALNGGEPAAGVDLRAVPAPVRLVWDWLAQHGTAYLVGGAARSLILGRAPHDWDLAVSLPPDEVMALVRAAHPAWEVRPTGIPWGTVTIAPTIGATVEVTSFRADGVYRDARRPASVRFGASWAEDAARRDFTVNALAISPAGEVVDVVGGLADLRRGIVRAVGRPEERLHEDPLRIWRGVRLLSQGCSTLDGPTGRAMVSERHRLAHVAPERQGQELLRLLSEPSPSALAPALSAWNRLGVADVVWPEWVLTRTFRGAGDRGEALDAHAVRTALGLPSALRLAGLLHDIAKPATWTWGREGHMSFAGHAEVGALWARHMLTRLRVSRQLVDRVAWLVAHHTFAWETASRADWAKLVVHARQGWLADLLVLYEADERAKGTWRDEQGAELKRRFHEVVASGRLSPHCSGDDVQAWLGIPAGPAVGQVLDQLRAFVWEHPDQNQPERLEEEARRLAAEWAKTRRDSAGGGP